MQITLLNYMGTKSGPALIRHFLEYYYRLGVDDFFIILHAEKKEDPRRHAALEMLKMYGIEPIMEVHDYSGVLRRERFLRIMDEHCKDDDWVLTPDLDEFIVFPDQIRTFLGQCDCENYNVVVGSKVDRLAAQGALQKIRATPSLWEQFPYNAPVSEKITDEFPRKQCVVKGFFRVDDGSHFVINRTEEIREHPIHLPVYHFKWDATVVDRYHDMLDVRGGDRQRLDWPCLVPNAERFLTHLEENGGRIVVEPMEFAGIPKIPYVREPIVVPQPTCA